MRGRYVRKLLFFKNRGRGMRANFKMAVIKHTCPVCYIVLNLCLCMEMNTVPYIISLTMQIYFTVLHLNPRESRQSV